jgi:hypothetical protein
MSLAFAKSEREGISNSSDMSDILDRSSFEDEGAERNRAKVFHGAV